MSQETETYSVSSKGLGGCNLSRKAQQRHDRLTTEVCRIRQAILSFTIGFDEWFCKDRRDISLAHKTLRVHVISGYDITVFVFYNI